MLTLVNITIVPNIMSRVGFRLGYLKLTLTYSKGQLGRRNGVSPNILLVIYVFAHYKLRLIRANVRYKLLDK